MTDFEIAVLIGVGLAIVVVLALVARRAQPAPPKQSSSSSAVPADLVGIEDRIKAVENRVFEVEHGVNQLRTMMNALPTKDSVHGIALQVTELKGDLKVNNASTIATARTVERIEDWLKALELKALGGKAGNDPTGQQPPREVDFTAPRRLQTIFQANMASARSAGQWNRAQRTKAALPYILYVRTSSADPRLEHLTWVGLILPIDDPWWSTHWPPNGWGCKCSIRQITARERTRLLATPPGEGGISYTTEMRGDFDRAPEVAKSASKLSGQIGEDRASRSTLTERAAALAERTKTDKPVSPHFGDPRMKLPHPADGGISASAGGARGGQQFAGGPAPIQNFYGMHDPAETARRSMMESNREVRRSQARALHSVGRVA